MLSTPRPQFTSIQPNPWKTKYLPSEPFSIRQRHVNMTLCMIDSYDKSSPGWCTCLIKWQTLHFCKWFIRWRVRWAWWQAAARERRGDRTRTSCEKRRSSMLRFASLQRSVPRWEDGKPDKSDTVMLIHNVEQYFVCVCFFYYYLLFNIILKLSGFFSLKGVGWVCSEQRASQKEKEASWRLSLQRWVSVWGNAR